MEDTVKSNKTKRIITGWIISVISLACICMGAIPLLLFLLVLLFFAAREYTKILQNKGFRPSFNIIYLSVLVYAFLIFFRRFDLMPVVLSLSVIVAFLGVLFRGRQPYIANVATTVLGIMYVAWLPLHLLLVRQIGSEGIGAFKIGVNDGLYLVIMVFLVVIATDIGGYYFGSKFGKTKLSAVISPKKTWEGAVGATIFAMIVASASVFYTNLTLLQAITGGFLITTASQLGDLSESLIKRDAGVKDSSNILPGHGGILDRADGFAFALPVAYYYFVNFTQGHNILLEFLQYAEGVLRAYF